MNRADWYCSWNMNESGRVEDSLVVLTQRGTATWAAFQTRKCADCLAVEARPSPRWERHCSHACRPPSWRGPVPISARMHWSCRARSRRSASCPRPAGDAGSDRRADLVRIARAVSYGRTPRKHISEARWGRRKLPIADAASEPVPVSGSSWQKPSTMISTTTTPAGG